MKKLFSSLVIAALLQLPAVNAQPIPEKNNDAVNGQVTLPDNSVMNGAVKDNIRKKGEVILLQDGKKTRYNADQVTSVQVGHTTYMTNNNTFYELIWQGRSITLLRKASRSSAIQYNGTDVVSASGSEGDVDDLFVKRANDPSFHLLTRKNQKEVLAMSCSTCKIDETKFDTESVKKAVADCDSCK